MKILEKEFISGVGGFSSEPLIYTQIARESNIAVYQRSREGGIVKDYETIVIGLTPKGTELFGKISEEDKEHYPSTGQFSKFGFSFHGLKAREAALNKMQDLLREKQEKSAPEIKKDLIIPKGEFSTRELADLNKIDYVVAANFIKENKENSIVFVREERRNTKGKATRLYKEISLT